MNKPEHVLTSIRNILKTEGVQVHDQLGQGEIVRQYVINTLEKNKDIQQALYQPITFDNQSIVRKLKNSVINKIANIVRNVVEKSFIKQQKYNDNLLIVIQLLLKENEELKSKIEKSTK